MRRLQLVTVFLLLLATAMCFATGPASAQGGRERITEFHSDIRINADGSMDVTETITVQVNGFQIKRGIIREFPTSYTDSEGKLYRVGFKLFEVRRDGVPEQYETSKKNNGVSIRIGNPNYYLQSGEHVYSIRYRTDRQLGFFEEHDELYWNVNGIGWTFGVDRVSADVTLPEDVPEQELGFTAYTGNYGITGRDYAAEVTAPDRIYFETTKPLGPKAGMTIVVQFPKGIVDEPTQSEKTAYWFQANAANLIALIGTIFVAFILFASWLRVGKDPHAGIITPQNEPPREMSPAALRYITRMYLDFTGFTAAILSLATKGILRVDETADGDFTVHQTSNEYSALPPEEQALAKSIFSRSNKLEFIQENRSRITSAQAAVRRSLDKQFNTVFFVRNGDVVWQGIGWSVVVVILTAIAISLPYSYPSIVLLILCAIALFFINIVFAIIMPSYTALGRMVMDRIEGFRLALAGGTDDLGEEHYGSHTLVQEYLPYAIALGVQNQWARRMDGAMRRRAEQEGVGLDDDRFRPYWYSGPHYYHSGYNNFRFNDFASNMSSEFNSTISSAATPPSSSSGGSGGGFSGGGGGGGGGSGW